MRAINREIARRIILQGKLNTLSEHMAMASQLDGYERRTNNLLSQGIDHQYQRKKNWKPRVYVSKDNHQGIPMEIDRLEPQEEKRRKENNLCFNCGKSGHKSRDCRSQRNEGSTSQSQGNGTPQKRRAFQGN